MKKLFSAIYLITSLLIALGAAGHSFIGVEKIHSLSGKPKADPAVYKLIIAVWHFAGLCMVMLGILSVFAWMRIRRGEKSLLIIPVTIGLFYMSYGIAAVTYTSEQFFAIFIILGLTLFMSTMLMRKS